MKLIANQRIFHWVTFLSLGILFSNIPSSCSLVNTDPCLSVVCQNGGVCADGECTCSKLFTGDRCQTAMDQVWELSFQDGGSTPHFQQIEVVVTSFTYSGTFSETADSPGLWMYDANGSECYRLHVGGNIFRATPGDHWSFVGMTGQGCGMSTYESGSSGSANGNFPYATGVSGQLILTSESPFGTASGEVFWYGRIKE